MREIKFRAWDKVSEKMIEWFDDFFSDESLITGFTGKFPDNDDIVLMQYTGLKDKNGKEIFEGDLVTYENRDEPGIVIWDDEDGSLAVEGDMTWYDVFAGSRRWCRLEVVGNIYEPTN